MRWFERKEVGQGACQSWLVAYCCNGYLKITKSIETDLIDLVRPLLLLAMFACLGSAHAEPVKEEKPFILDISGFHNLQMAKKLTVYLYMGSRHIEAGKNYDEEKFKQKSCIWETDNRDQIVALMNIIQKNRIKEVVETSDERMVWTSSFGLYFDLRGGRQIKILVNHPSSLMGRDTHGYFITQPNEPPKEKEFDTSLVQVIYYWLTRLGKPTLGNYNMNDKDYIGIEQCMTQPYNQAYSRPMTDEERNAK